ncbi:ANKIB1 [Symbiodinium sp. KB8]|nr:ANKIB1 [Symbiodinium sp. KB8]
MGAQQCRGCRCDCERQCSRLISFSMSAASLFASLWLSVPYTWANPFAQGQAITCHEVGWAAAFPSVFGGVAVGWLCCFCIAREWVVFPMISMSFLAVLALAVVSICLLIYVAAGSCDRDVERSYVMSTCLMLLCPFALFCCCTCNSCLSSWREGAEDRRRTREAQAEAAQREARAKRPRVRRAQRILREALIYGDETIADLLLDFRERRCRALWRMYRCVFLSLMHCQCRCSCCAGVPEDAEMSPASLSPSERGHGTPASRASASRASLFFSYDDEDAGEMPIHYLARGEHRVGEGRAAVAAAEAAQRCLVWTQRDQRLWKLPELTDERRARLLRELATSGRLPLTQLQVVNAAAQTPLHCAAASGSYAMAQELLSLLGHEVEAIGASVYTEEGQAGSLLAAEDAHGDSPCEVALRNGHVVCARLLAGDFGQWQGLLKLPQQRQALRECLSGALGRLNPDGSLSDVAIARHVVHEETQLLSALEQQIRQLQDLCGLVVASSRSPQLLPRDAAEAMLQKHMFDVQAAAAAFRISPREALDAAGLRSVDFHPADLQEHSGGTGTRTQAALDSDRAAPSVCIVCFDEVDVSKSACRTLLCKHRTCDDCLGMHVKVRLDEGDVTGVVCPEPNCRVPISEEILCLLFGSGSQEQMRLEQLKTRKFVDMNKNMAWCPAPGCGRAVSVPRQESQNGKSMSITAVCSCGAQFCFNCKALGGHEPVPCQPWQDFLGDLAKVRKQMEDETNKWLSQNSKTCTCGASIQRNGGCNHMICSVCGRHFCYICGQDWALHKGQPGGFDYYQCRLPASAGGFSGAAGPQAPTAGASAQDAKLWKLQRECLPGWTANERQPERTKLLFRALLVLAEEFDLGISIQEPRSGNDADSFVSAVSRESRGCRQAAWEGLLACIQARRCLQNCYVLKYHWPSESWRRSRLQTWVPELEGIVGALESALGLTMLESQAVRAGFPAGPADAASTNVPKLPQQPTDVVRLLDLRHLLPQAIAISEAMGALRQLGTAVSLQTARILSAGRTGFPEVGYFEDVWNNFNPERTPSRSRSERCCVM